MDLDPIITAIITGFRKRADRIYPLRAALPTMTASFSLGESRSVLDGIDSRIEELASSLFPWPEIDPFGEHEISADLQCDPTIDEAEFAHRIAEYRKRTSADFERETKTALAYRDAAKPAVLAMVTDFAMHATAADLDSDLYNRLNNLLAEVGLSRIAELNDHHRHRALAVIAAR
ncbi:hypothetical protein [Brevibacterium sp. FME17]|uniref:hypothetical protein n=1 Tax=Brevibacterium sp. FME17 TaxID=2742606 RepID=UPI00186679A7|nr:hypothetical protein [Brevibacterium sp. FME17]